MQLYLSSYRLGNHAEKLGQMVVGNKRIGVIRNALDFSNDTELLDVGRKREFKALKAIGLSPQAIDLRDHFHAKEHLLNTINDLDALWVVGGNTFILRKAMHQSGLDEILKAKAQDSNFVYAGYSAGICVMTPTLRGIDLVDDKDSTPQGYISEVIWEGLGFLSFSIAPHYKSNHREPPLIDKTIEYFIKEKLPFIALQDGEVYFSNTQ